MQPTVSAQVTPEMRRRLIAYAKSRGYIHPSQRPNVSAATREVLAQGLQAIEAKGVGGGNVKATDT